MIQRLILIAISTLLLTACNTFEENLKADQEATTTKGMNEKQEQAVAEFAVNGQLNPEEKKLMDQSIDASGTPAGE